MISDFYKESNSSKYWAEFFILKLLSLEEIKYTLLEQKKYTLFKIK